MAGRLNRKYTEYLIYLIFWGTLLFSPVWGSILGGSKIQVRWDELVQFWEFLIPAAILFVINNSILVPFFLIKRRGGYYIVYILCVVIALALVYVFSPGNVPGAKPPRDVERVLHDRPQLGVYVYLDFGNAYFPEEDQEAYLSLDFAFVGGNVPFNHIRMHLQRFYRL